MTRQPAWPVPVGLRFQDGYLLRATGGCIPCPEEEDVFAALGLAWIPPEERGASTGGGERERALRDGDLLRYGLGDVAAGQRSVAADVRRARLSETLVEDLGCRRNASNTDC